ncbi:hypothetical protein EYD45_08165 [Hyunsoonleella flava]|uniref:Uncharacterized protein n=1 Tax=Hyunsoonleella flava TaxID=2527939 RepID=A0A4Q9FEY1_9FLAO|nr:hypothetical protein [Hyunsoonleella flava]TBN03978.1 hypothetical protein EYD45_08165 [Hyunsoonleella flava]
MKSLNDDTFPLILMGLFILLIALTPAIIISLIGSRIKMRRPKTAKILQIIAIVYTIIGFGTCGVILTKM